MITNDKIKRIEKLFYTRYCDLLNNEHNVKTTLHTT